MYTSTFARAGKRPEAVSVARAAPDWFAGRVAPELAPPEHLLREYTRHGDSYTYSEAYHAEVLDKLDPFEILDLYGESAILVCWEAAGKFCHRRLIAWWLEQHTGTQILEIEPAWPRGPVRVIAPDQTTLGC